MLRTSGYKVIKHKEVVWRGGTFVGSVLYTSMGWKVCVYQFSQGGDRKARLCLRVKEYTKNGQKLPSKT